jgi:hypothetical protein
MRLFIKPEFTASCDRCGQMQKILALKLVNIASAPCQDGLVFKMCHACIEQLKFEERAAKLMEEVKA